MRILRTLLLSAALAAPLLAGAGPSPAAAGTPGTPGEAADPAGVRWTSDDYLKALSEAKARRVPIFVDAWAPW